MWRNIEDIRRIAMKKTEVMAAYIMWTDLGLYQSVGVG